MEIPPPGEERQHINRACRDSHHCRHKTMLVEKRNTPSFHNMKKRVLLHHESAVKRRRLSLEPNPAEIAQEVLQEKNSESVPTHPSQVSELQLAGFSMPIVSAIRQGDLPGLRKLLEEGTSFVGCNRNAESLLHLACRRSTIEVVRFLLCEAKVDPNLVDCLGRSILHEVCWKSNPDTELMELTLQFVSPSLLVSTDIRGHSPLDYARREHWGVWNDFLRRLPKTMELP